MLPLVTLHHKLMSPRNETQSVDMNELFGNILSKRITCTSRADSPSKSIIGIRPDEIAHWSLVWHLLDTVQITGLVKSIDAWAESAVKAKYLASNNSGHGQIVKCICEIFPHVGIAVFSKTLVIKAIPK